jgi:tRNA nucleotidyltransferase (CCA-adding enzyme)
MNLSRENIPPFVSYVTEKIQEKGFEAFLVGGCVRDMILGRTPGDWDITTSATPEDVQQIFSDLKTVCENNFGTVTILNMPANAEDRVTRLSDGALAKADVTEDEMVQVTTYRSEGGYEDARHPGTVTYETDILKDLERRDFTMNAIAWDPIKDIYNDPFDGLKDIKDKTIRCVLYPNVRYNEDALRMLRAVRFSTVLGFGIEKGSFDAILENSALLQKISQERIRDEFVKIINSGAPAFGIELLRKTGLLTYIIPELLEGVGCEQKGAHIYDVYTHCLHALQHAADKNFTTNIRLSALFHDIGKPKTRRYDRSRDKYTFFGHEVVGAHMTKKILDRLQFSRETVTHVTKMVRNHMFFSDTEQISLSAVRRIVQKVSVEHIWELMEVRECDRVGMKKAEAPYRLRKYHAMIEEVLRDPISVGQLAIDGSYLIETLHMKPGPRMGWMLHALLEEVLENPALNTAEQLSDRVKDLDELEDKDLKALGEKGKEKKEELDGQEVEKLHQKHGVKTNRKS